MSAEKIVWLGNSQAMFDALLQQTPAFMRARVQTTLTNWMQKNSVTEMTEALFERHVLESTPPMMHAMLLQHIQPLRSSEQPNG